MKAKGVRKRILLSVRLICGPSERYPLQIRPPPVIRRQKVLGVFHEENE